MQQCSHSGIPAGHLGEGSYNSKLQEELYMEACGCGIQQLPEQANVKLTFTSSSMINPDLVNMEIAVMSMTSLLLQRPQPQ